MLWLSGLPAVQYLHECSPRCRQEDAEGRDSAGGRACLAIRYAWVLLLWVHTAAVVAQQVVSHRAGAVVDAAGVPPDDDDFPMLMALECSATWQPEHVAPRMLHRMFKDGREKAEKFL